MHRRHRSVGLHSVSNQIFKICHCLLVILNCTCDAEWQRRDNKRVLNDFYFKEAKRSNYLSRAAYKLLQIEEKFKILRKHGTVLDLGCFPGAWLQVACQELGAIDRGGRIVGIDLKEMKVPTVYCDERVTVCCPLHILVLPL